MILVIYVLNFVFVIHKAVIYAQTNRIELFSTLINYCKLVNVYKI